MNIYGIVREPAEHVPFTAYPDEAREIVDAGEADLPSHLGSSPILSRRLPGPPYFGI
ncbi:hypothetical protein DV517_64980 [Streptomyces sp. S816]|uniref:hypothetical protein n=1 Tax=Streptomyces TaxID=1883 RepID=UPI00113E8AFE|nr:hypothetical protein [Streptomyces sp. S816]TGZ15015.1 hypothetical protein DV517_64980 [Streptomyces sp. S816]